MLSGLEIIEEMKRGRIKIEPFDPECVNPNSVDLHLGNGLLVYKNHLIDTGKANDIVEYDIPIAGQELKPGFIYLASTVEYTETHPPWVPCIEGKS